MKMFIFLSVLFLSLASATMAQKRSIGQMNTPAVSHVDGTMQHLQWMQQQDPELQQKMKVEGQKFNEYIAAHATELKNSKTSYTIPVVVHVVYKNTATGYVSPQRVQEQIDQTNLDWAGLNLHSMGPFSDSLKANTGITLCLASMDPSGNPTTGIDFKQTTVTSFSTNDGVKSASTGGADAWDPAKYLNIWVCNLGGGLCGYAQFPTSGINQTYGVVIHYQFFGLTGATAPYDGGATMSHELGHCFNLFHLTGDASCADADGCPDTPTEYGTQSSLDSCIVDQCNPSCPGIMYMNFMGYNDDANMANLTPDQAARMQACVATYLYSNQGYSSVACAGGCTAFFELVADTATLHHYYVLSYAGGVAPVQYFWDWGDGSSDTIAYPSHIYDTAGYYTICLTVTDWLGCTTTYCDSNYYVSKSDNELIYVDVIPHETVSVSEFLAHKGFNIYPNPAKDHLMIENSSALPQNSVLSIYDLRGKLLFRQDMEAPKINLNVSSFAKGMYVLKIEGDSSVEVLKFVKE